MNIITQGEFENGREFHGCGRCFGSGVCTVANGTDDYDEDFCDCQAGDELQSRGFARPAEPAVEQESHAQFDVSRIAIDPWHKLDWFDI